MPETDGGKLVSETRAEPETDGVDWLVATISAEVVPEGIVAAAVKRPLELIVPKEPFSDARLHVTAGLKLPVPVTDAVHWLLWPA